MENIKLYFEAVFLSKTAKKIYRLLPFFLSLIFALISLAAVLYYTIWPAEGYLHSDCTDTIFWAQASVDAGAVFNPDFNYAALLPFSAGLWLVPLIKIFGVTMGVHVAGMVIFALLFFAALLFVCRSLGWSWRFTFLCTGAMMLLLSSSDKMREIMWGHVIYYSLGLLILFVGLGLLLRMCRNFENKKIKRAVIYAVLLFIFMMLGATNGFQCIAIYTLPLAGAIAADIFFNAKEKIFSRRNLYFGFGLAILTLSTVAGLALLSALKGDIIAGYAEAYSLLDDVSKWVTHLMDFNESYLSLFGINIQDGASLASAETITNILKIIVAFSLFLLPAILLFCYKKIEERSTRILLWAHLVVSSVIMVGFVCGRLSAGNWRLIPMVGTSIITSFAAIRFLFSQKDIFVWRRFAAVMLVFPLLCSLSNAKAISDMPKDYGRDNDLHVIADFLVENELEYGYAEFWKAQAVTLIADSKTKVRNVNINYKDGITPYHYQSNNRWFEEQEGIEEYFVLLSSYESSTLSRNAEWQEKLENNLIKTLHCGDFVIFVFNQNIFPAAE